MGIVTDGLVGYWHYQQGVSGGTWENIAPDTKGQYDGTINGATLQSDGMYFDGVDDNVVALGFTNIDVRNFTLEVLIIVPSDNRTQSLLGFDSSNQMYIFLNRLHLRRRGASLSLSGYGTIGSGLYHLIISYDGSTYRGYVNGVKYETQSSLRPLDNPTTVIFSPDNSQAFNGKLIQFKFYNRMISDAEVLQNYLVGTAIGLVDEPPQQEPPKPTIINISRTTISDEPTMDIATVTFTFDQDVTEWRVRTIGTDHDTGILADSGGAVSAGTEITAEVDYTELYGEGQNRVNIYGKNADGQWTPYT